MKRWWLRWWPLLYVALLLFDIGDIWWVRSVGGLRIDVTLLCVTAAAWFASWRAECHRRALLESEAAKLRKMSYWLN